MEFALVRLLFLALFSVSFAAINLDIRTRGVPKSDTNEGNRFCFSFITNKEPVDNLRVLTIFIGTQERENVQYRIRSGTPDVSRNGTVSPGEIIQEQFYDSNMQTDTGSTRARNDLTGIIVETVNSSQKIAVSGFNDATGSSEGFAAVPMFNVPSFTKSYNYTIFADGPESPVSAMVACGHIEAGGVTIDNTSPTTVRPRGGYFRSRVRNGQTVSSSIDFEEYYNPVLTNNDDEISGLRVFATVPIGFMVGHECGEIPLGKLNCDHLLEQMPPSYTWGYNFLIAPYHSRYAGYIVKVLGGYKTDTNFRLFCDNGTAIAVDNYVDIQSRTPNKGVFDITTQSFCTIQSNRPLAVIQYAKGHDVDDDDTRKEKDFADPQMTWIPSVSQYLNRYLMSNNVSSRPLSAQHFTSNGLYVTVLPECFNTSAILDNGTPIERDTCKWSRFYCNNFTDVCGYGISVEVSQARHLLRHMDSRCTFGAVMFGWGNQKGYGFPAGFGMAPVGVPVYSIEPLIPSALEGSTGPVSVTVYKSGDISQASTVKITTFSSSKSNAATIGQDLSSQTRTVAFAAGKASAIVNFTFSDDTSHEFNEVFMIGFVKGQDIVVGTPSTAELGIINDDGVFVYNIEPLIASAVEGSTGPVSVTVYKSGDISQASAVQITTFMSSKSNAATIGQDLSSQTKAAAFAAGQASAVVNFTFFDDATPEVNEVFMVGFVAGQDIVIGTPSAAELGIIDDDSQLQDYQIVDCYSSFSDCISQTNGVSIRAIDCCIRTGGSYIRHSLLQTQCGACIVIGFDKLSQQMGGSQVTKTTAQILLRTASVPSISTDFRFNIWRLPETLPDNIGDFLPLLFNGQNNAQLPFTFDLQASSQGNGNALEPTAIVTYNITAASAIPLGAAMVYRSFTVQVVDRDEMYVKFQTPVPVITEGHNAIAVIKRRVISYRAPFEVTVSLEKYTGPLRPDEGALGNTDLNFTVQKSIVFDPLRSNQNSESVSFFVPRDNIVELSEYFVWRLSINNSLVSIRAPGRTQIVKVNNEDVFSIGFRDLAITIKEGEVATLVIQQIGDDKGGKNVGGLPEEQIEQVVLRRSSGTAAIPGQFGADYNFYDIVPRFKYTSNNTLGDITFSPVKSLQDNFIEGDETLKVIIMSLNYEIIQVPTSRQTATITIIDDDSGELSIERGTYNVIENEGSVEICVVLTGGVMSEDTDINLETSPNTAKSGSDYSIAKDPFIFLTLPRNTSRICIGINIINDTIWEDLYEDFMVKINQIIPEVSALRVNTDLSTIRIQDDDLAEVRFAIGQATFSEGGGNQAIIFILQNGQLANNQNVEVYIDDGTDTGISLGSVTFNTGSVPQNRTVTFPVINNNVAMEPDKHYMLRLRNLGNLGLGIPGTMNITVVDDDPGRLSLEKKTYNVTEDVGSVELCAVLTGGVSPYPMIISILDIGGTAKFPTDYTYLYFYTTLPVSQNRTCTTLNIVNDNIKETSEYFFMYIYRVIPWDVNKLSVDHSFSSVWIQDDD